ncbi:MAG: DUF5683 domain-containing protein [Ignavibacteriales bacterium]|nr:DUF5683 domain-containing protein [Ignavibacteriales bacterium]
MKHLTYMLTAAFLLSATAGLSAYAQGLLPQSSALPKMLRLNEDSLISAATATRDTIVRQGKSTTVALLSSMVIPGAGQMYNGSYWKAPVVWGTGYYLWSVYHRQDDLYRQHRAAYSASIVAETPNGDGRERELRDFYRRQRDTFGWYMAFAYLINVLDAYVEASLYGFEVSPNLNATNNIQWIGLQVRF